VQGDVGDYKEERIFRELLLQHIMEIIKTPDEKGFFKVAKDF